MRSVLYDIVLMDYLMPEMDGVETTRQIMEISNGKNQPKIIGVSATVDEAVTRLFTDAGADCQAKPGSLKCLKTVYCNTFKLLPCF